ncbi:MAG: lysophospholipid acyltransferase family protein [Paracoccaceae bacterium]
MSSSRLTKIQQWLVNLAIVSVIRSALALPYSWRVPFVGWVVTRIIGPFAGYRASALDNLALIRPELSEPERKTIAKACLDNAGRTFIENYSAIDFPNRMAAAQITGPGWPALQQADAQNRPVILVTGHYGNYEAVRAALVGKGYNVGGLYRDMSNPYFNAHYVKTMESFGGPVFPQGRKGTSGFVRHLKSGGQLVLLFDQHVIGAPVLDFMGQPAHTAVSAAELALRYNAVLIPFFGVRKADGLSFDTILDAPIPHSDPQTMTQAMNESLAARIRQDPGQWFWVHRRWRA